MGFLLSAGAVGWATFSATRLFDAKLRLNDGGQFWLYVQVLSRDLFESLQAVLTGVHAELVVLMVEFAQGGRARHAPRVAWNFVVTAAAKAHFVSTAII